MSSTESGNPESRPMIQLSRVTRQFGSTRAVDDLSFDVQPGEVFGFIGPNGAGKTTTMRILATLDVPCSGTAWVDGFSVINDPDRVRRRLGFMPDSYGTYPNVNCEEYLDFFARAYGLRGNQRREALRWTMHFTQLDRLAQKPVNGLSKGMRQRLCLGRALIHDPSVLILDEPAAGLDPRARIELREMICKLAEQGKSLLVSSHILTELAEMCDRVGIIEQGRLLAVGTVDEILHGQGSVDPEVPVPATNAWAKIEMTVFGDPSTAIDWLRSTHQLEASLLMPGPNRGKNGDAKTIEFEFSGDELAQCQLLTELVQNGTQVVSYRRKQKSLEDAFLQVTRGNVQ